MLDLPCGGTLHRSSAHVRNRRSLLQVVGARASPRRAPLGDARPDVGPRPGQRRRRGLPEPGAARAHEADALLARRGVRLGTARARGGSRAARRRPRRRRRACPQRASRAPRHERGARDRDLQGGRAAPDVRRAVPALRFRRVTRARAHAHGDGESRHDGRVASVLDWARSLPRAQRLALESQPPAA